ncbi:MAG: ABC transporter permease, partial [Gemmataceae bacterium]
IILGLALLGVLIVPLFFWDKARRNLELALRSLWLHKLRAFLSVLGIIIGTGAVISLMAFGEGSMHDALEDIKRMGATNIIVRSVKPPDDSSTQRRTFIAAYGLTQSDYDRFETLMQSGTITRMVPMRIFPQELKHLEQIYNGRVVGTIGSYADVNQLEMAAGRFLTKEDNDRMSNVAVLAAEVADAFFPFSDPLGQTIRLGDYYYRVVGVCKPRMPTGGSGGSQAAEDYNNDVYIPIDTCRARFGSIIYIRASGSRSGEQVELSQVTLTVSDMDRVRPTGEMIEGLLDRFHQRKDWAVTIPLDRLEEAERARNRYTMLLALIASISLVVGGIGIMNIMLATVTERVREIGIRRALGAKRRDITLQFLIEAVAQTTIGGLLGVISGLSIVFALPKMVEYATKQGWLEMNLPAQIHVPSIFIALVVAVVVGVVAGLYPALRAARLDPIEALRHE